LDPATLSDQYALIVEGDCLSPTIKTGTTVSFDKNLPIAKAIT
jgi:hypothetical protein